MQIKLTKHLYLSLFFSFIFSSCSFAPFATTPTARTNGAGQSLIQGSLVEAQVPSLRFEYGLLPNLDVGFETEFGFGSYVTGLYSKLAIIPNAQGLASAIILGYGKNLLGDDGEYWYLGPVLSYRFTYFEPAFLLRYTDSRIDNVDLNESTGDINFTGDHLRYWYWVVSGTVYPVDSFGIIFQAADAVNVKGGNGRLIDGLVFTVGVNLKL